jgi:beta-glucoside operon transcriptional antiterminator
MKVIKNINNNVAVCLDSTGKEVIVTGKGVGFKKPPYELQLSEIDRTYYDVDEIYVSMIRDLPDDVLKVSDEIILYARKKYDIVFSSNIVFTLADHLNFAIKRNKENIKVKLPIVNDIEQLFEKEIDIGNYGVKLIRKKLGVYLPREEAAYIALHLINSEQQTKNKSYENSEQIIEKITKIVEAEYNLEIDKHDFNYSRFVTHIHYLLKRGKDHELLKTDNGEMYKTLVKEYPKTYETSEEIRKYLKDELSLELNDEEMLYLMLHINRLCTREDCN